MSETESDLVLRAPFAGLSPEIVDTSALGEVEKVAVIRDVLLKSVDMPYRLEVFQGELLYKVKQDNLFKQFEKDDGTTFSTFDEYVADELGFGRRKAYDLIDIYRTFVVDLSLPPAKLDKISWAKARLVTKHVNKDNADSVLEKIEDMTVNQVKEFVDEMKAESAPPAVVEPDEVFIKITLQLAPDQAENVQAALEAAQRISGSEKVGNNIDLICTSFLANPSEEGLEGTFHKLDQIKSAVEKQFGVKLEVTEMDETRVAAIEGA
jgi:hypothetical protein